MVDKLRLEKFKKSVCNKLCRICQNPTPTFCCSIAMADPDRFIEILKHMMIYGPKIFNESKTKKSFSAFGRVFCNFYRDCPMKSEDCELIDNVVYCFGLYCEQEPGRDLTTMERARIYALFSGISMKLIGNDIPIKMSPLEGMKKKKKKKVSRLFESIRHTLTNSPTEKKSKLRKKNEPKKPTTTSWFWNDNDEEWGKWIRKILGHETDNRQLDNADGHTSANDGLVNNATNN